MGSFLPISTWLLVPCLAAAWLLPNHSPPWTAFHSEFLAATICWILAVIVFIKNKHHLSYSAGVLLLWALTIQVGLNWYCGLISNVGIAWTVALYVIGSITAIRLGTIWQVNADGGPVSFIYSAIIFASIVSVFLQLVQSVGFQSDSQWINSAPPDLRMDANLAQPNNLASLYLMALVGCSWFWTQKKIKAFIAIGIAGLLSIGLALTASRTGFFGAIFIFCIWPWMASSGSKDRAALITLAAILVAWLLLLVTIIPMMSKIIEARTFGASVSTRSGDGRLAIWSLALDAIGERPLWGYGWGQIHAAQMTVAAKYPAMGALNSAHNLILDIALWGGGVAALSVTAYGVWRIYTQISAPINARQIHTLLGIGVIIFHSMLELPLHYAYFLLPFGVLWGSLESVSPALGYRRVRKIICILFTVLLGGGALIVAKDYLKVERAEKILRLEFVTGKIQASDEERMPKMSVLDYYEDFFLLSRLPPVAGLDSKQLHEMELIVKAVPSDLLIYNMAANFALNKQPIKAKEWMQILCKTRSQYSCRSALTKWRRDGRFDQIALSLDLREVFSR
ncbi:MAG: hypothetical protein EWV78_03785 [Microcystis aeruginosa Ma_MB_F_20061100_S20D]|uniref:Uncharacterized protein n=1 Tax=Microcystis aeruginosa Ma_MB_F_20061100_S20D TaxID=2486253 RepID=A0A552EX81_MICAE|nr:MAG: hypothetical protein EWV78_03785 [Microcystis aeruginosa Ma_MB_F_20061100_S20D]